MFDQAAEDMAGTGFTNMCPVASVAAEVAETVDELPGVTAGVFTGWLVGGTAYLIGLGLPEPTAREVAVTLIGALEGAFVLAQTLRSAEPLTVTGRVLGAPYHGVGLSPATAAAGMSLHADVGASG